MRIAYSALLACLCACAAADGLAQKLSGPIPAGQTLVGEPVRPDISNLFDVGRRMHVPTAAAAPAREPEAAAYYREALACESGAGAPPDLARASQLYLRAARLGHPDAMLALGQMYQSGRGLARDDAAAAGWYRSAAEAGSVLAQYNLALLLADGSGVPRDVERAMAWYERAARSGFGKAQFNLALLLEQRHGTPSDLERAYAWFKLAGAGGIGIAQGRLAALAPSMSPEQLARADRQAAEWRAGAHAD